MQISYDHEVKGSVYVYIYAQIFVQDQKFILQTVIFRSFRKYNSQIHIPVRKLTEMK